MSDRVWHVPLLVLAGVTALLGIGVGIAVWRGALPAPWGPAIQWALAGASLTFTGANIARAKRVGRREIELVVLGAAIIFAQYFVLLGAAIVALALVLLILEAF